MAEELIAAPREREEMGHRAKALASTLYSTVAAANQIVCGLVESNTGNAVTMLEQSK